MFTFAVISVLALVAFIAAAFFLSDAIHYQHRDPYSPTEYDLRRVRAALICAAILIAIGALLVTKAYLLTHP